MHHVKSEGVGVNLNESIQCLLLSNPGFFKNNKKLNKSNGPIGQIKMMDQRGMVLNLQFFRISIM